MQLVQNAECLDEGFGIDVQASSYIAFQGARQISAHSLTRCAMLSSINALGRFCGQIGTFADRAQPKGEHA